MLLKTLEIIASSVSTNTFISISSLASINKLATTKLYWLGLTTSASSEIENFVYIDKSIN